MNQQSVIERDYGMNVGKVVITWRQSFLPYFFRHINLINETDQAMEQQLTIVNR